MYYFRISEWKFGIRIIRYFDCHVMSVNFSSNMFAALVVTLCFASLTAGNSELCFVSTLRIVLNLGQITSEPENPAISVGENITITCNTTTNAVIPSLRINGQVTDNNLQVTDITPVGSENKLRVFLFSFASKDNNGIVFSCTNTAGMLTLSVLCELSFWSLNENCIHAADLL